MSQRMRLCSESVEVDDPCGKGASGNADDIGLVRASVSAGNAIFASVEEASVASAEEPSAAGGSIPACSNSALFRLGLGEAGADDCAPAVSVKSRHRTTNRLAVDFMAGDSSCWMLAWWKIFVRASTGSSHSRGDPHAGLTLLSHCYCQRSKALPY